MDIRKIGVGLLFTRVSVAGSAILLAACALASPTPTPTPQPAALGVHTPEDLRRQFETWPEKYKFAIDQDVVVRLAYPSPIIDWAGFAFIDHIPSASSLTLASPIVIVGSDGQVLEEERGQDFYGYEVRVRKHYKSDEGRSRLESVLTNDEMMQCTLRDAPLPPPTLTPKPTPISCSPQKKELPCGPRAEIGRSYPYQLYTHCGIRWAYFEGRWWEASPPLDDGSGNPPRGWGNPFDMGRMELVNESLSRFTSRAGKTAEFKPLPVEAREYPGKPCA